MCNRIEQIYTDTEILALFGFKSISQTRIRYNLAPTEIVQVARRRPEFEYADLKWGLVPSWAQDAGIGVKLLNARAETLMVKPAFKESFKSRRCLVPVNGFYEWKKPDKQPYLVNMKDSTVFALAGLWDRWHDLETFTIITTTPNPLVAELHNRMPVVIDPADFAEWLDPANQDPERLARMLAPYPAEKMAATAVSKFVNKAGNEGAECVRPVAVERFLF